MKVGGFARFGVPRQVCRCIEVADVGAPGEDEVVVEIPRVALLPRDLAWSRGLPIPRSGYPTPVLALKGAIQFAEGVIPSSTFANRMAVDAPRMLI